MLGSCKKAVDMIEYLINSRNGENLRYLQENFDLLYDLDIRRREKKKSFTLNVDLIRNSFQQVKKYYLKNFTMSQGLNNDESNFEEMLNKIFFEEGMEAPIKKYTYVTTISNGIFYREYPNYPAMTINLKEDMEGFITKEGFLTPSDNEINVILYGDDIDTTKIGHNNKNGVVTHIGYKIYHKNIVTSQLKYYRTYSVSESKKVKKNYASYLKACVNDFKNTVIQYQNRQLSIKIIAICGDNEFLQLLHGYKLNWRDIGSNNCRCCFVDGRNWKYYRSVESIEGMIRPSDLSNGLPLNNHLISDPFHDLHEGIASYALYSSVCYSKILFSDLTSSYIYQGIMHHATLLNYDKPLKSILNEKIFLVELEEIDITKKGKLPLSGSNTLYILRCFYEFLKAYISYTNIEDNNDRIKANQLIIYLQSVLGLCYLSQDPEIDVGVLKVEWVKHTNIFFKSTYAVFGERYRQFTKMHNTLHIKYMIDYYDLQLFHFSTIRFESANARIKQLLLLSKNRRNISKTIITKSMYDSYLENFKEKEEEAFIADNRNWNYDFQNMDCLDISLNRCDAEESLLENIVYSINQSLESQNTTYDNDDETYQEESFYDSDDD
uniref:MchC protein n=1 Tax=Strongyloides papillosus TaxID=174720 RepID=A0A0N5CBB2_STREA